jgi:hypothetical protein
MDLPGLILARQRIAVVAVAEMVVVGPERHPGLGDGRGLFRGR